MKNIVPIVTALAFAFPVMWYSLFPTHFEHEASFLHSAVKATNLDGVCSGFDIPVVIIAFNNPSITAPLVRQLRDCFPARVILIDMCSTFSGMTDYLNALSFSNDLKCLVGRESFLVAPAVSGPL